MASASPKEPAWRRVVRAAGLEKNGVVSETIFAEMSQLAASLGAVNLGQGAPDDNPPAEMIEAARRALREGKNQYAPGRGTPDLREAIAAHNARFSGQQLDPTRQVVVTAGATEGIAAAILAFVETSDDEIVLFEPYYDSYIASVALANARVRTVPLVAPLFQPDLDVLASVVNDKTRMIVVNDPHNPTGSQLSPASRAEIVRLATQHDALILSDEVYEHLVFDDAHVPFASTPGASERTITLSSAGKTFSCTGWKVGWATGPAHLIDGVVGIKQFLTYTNASALQPAVAVGLALPDAFFAGVRSSLAARQATLAKGLSEVGFTIFPPAAGYFTVADASALGCTDGREFCLDLAHRAGVVAIPVDAFVSDAAKPNYAPLIRFAACKTPEAIDEAMRRLRAAQLGIA